MAFIPFLPRFWKIEIENCGFIDAIAIIRRKTCIL